MPAAGRKKLFPPCCDFLDLSRLFWYIFNAIVKTAPLL
jgi:hypothetical protein